MQVITAKQFREMITEDPHRGYVFAEYDSYSGSVAGELRVLDDNGEFDEQVGFGATNVIPEDDLVIDWDFDINDYHDEDEFVLFDRDDVMQMIKTLLIGVKIYDKL